MSFSRKQAMATAFLLTGVTRADDPIVLVWSSIAGGSASMGENAFQLVGTAGQAPVSEVLTDGTFTLYNGFWVPATTGTRPRCPADFNRDDAVDFADYDAFVSCFEGDACPPGRFADFNRDGAIDMFDYDDFVTAFEAPC
ncbi:MAG: hypothetical protein AABZ53_08445 [Planctomycetota bacterium]